jgi:8-oxo-dGTP pyrophosphatase MutT (NUDIX family)
LDRSTGPALDGPDDRFGEVTPRVTPPQVVPRPPDARPGAAAPWGALPATPRRGVTLDRVVGRLAAVGQAGDLPAGDVRLDPWVAVNTLDPLDSGTRESAVLVALFEEDGETRVLLTRRSTRLRSHKGEVSFPGGRIDDGEDAPAAALREATEEVALDAATVSLVGWLHPVLTFATGSHITPVVATLPGRPESRPNPAEVERVFDVSLAELLADGVFHEERWTIPGHLVPSSADGSFPVWFYETAGELIWGATARMLTELLCMVLELGPPPGPTAAAKP